MRLALFSNALLLLSIFSISYASKAQAIDTLRVMTYNVLNYQNNTIPGCSNTNNSRAVKDQGIDVIIGNTLPDILVCNEIGSGSPLYSFQLLSGALNRNSRNKYFLANATGINRTPPQSLVNMLYFDSSKLVLVSQNTIDKDVFNGNIVRVIDIYRLYYKEPNLSQIMDTVFINVIAAHLKAGNSSTDELKRARATQAVMAYLDTINASGNYILAGDLNLYRSSEAAYQNMLNYVDPNLRFYDPINVSGTWSNRSSFGIVHTQSTRTSSGCGASGGMDDRFDFLLISDELRNGTDRLNYISNSYLALGQDGRRFNGSISNPTNTSVPPNVVQALGDVSDHLPVLMDLEVKASISTTLVSKDLPISRIVVNNPFRNQIKIDVSQIDAQLIELLDLTGKVIERITPNEERFYFSNTTSLSKGVYFLRCTTKSNQQFVQKLMKI